MVCTGEQCVEAPDPLPDEVSPASSSRRNSRLRAISGGAKLRIDDVDCAVICRHCCGCCCCCCLRCDLMSSLGRGNEQRMNVSAIATPHRNRIDRVFSCSGYIKSKYVECAWPLDRLVHEATLAGCYAAVLPNKPHYVSCSSGCPGRASNFTTKRRTNMNIAVDVPRGSSTGVPVFRSKVKVTVHEKPRENGADIASIFTNETSRGVDMGQGDTSPQYLDWGDIITNVPLNISRVISATFYPCNIFLIS